jgi:hypothetical protein
MAAKMLEISGNGNEHKDTNECLKQIPNTNTNMAIENRNVQQTLQQML